MAELVFFYGTMNCGKSTLALQIHHNAVAAGRHCLLLTRHDRSGGTVTSRIGLAQPATTVSDELDLAEHVRALIASGRPVDTLICDEVQFYAPAQVDQLAELVDELDIEVQAFGLLTDFTTQLFPGSKRLLELADRRQELQVEARCWCGRRGTLNARTAGGRIQREGRQIVVGDVGRDQVAYEVLCRAHHRQGITAELADRDPDLRSPGVGASSPVHRG